MILGPWKIEVTDEGLKIDLAGHTLTIANQMLKDWGYVKVAPPKDPS